MGAGASSAAPEDVEILTSFLGSLREHGKLNEVTDAAVKAHLEAKIGAWPKLRRNLLVAEQ